MAKNTTKVKAAAKKTNTKKTNNKKEVKNEFTPNPVVEEQVKKLEEEFNKEYGGEFEAAKEYAEKIAKAGEIDMSDTKDIFEEYANIDKKINDMASEKDQAKLIENIGEELDKAEGMKDRLEKSIAEAESKITEEQKTIVNRLYSKGDFSGFWNGVSYEY
jgi:hypothetical protein